MERWWAGDDHLRRAGRDGNRSRVRRYRLLPGLDGRQQQSNGQNPLPENQAGARMSQRQRSQRGDGDQHGGLRRPGEKIIEKK